VRVRNAVRSLDPAAISKIAVKADRPRFVYIMTNALGHFKVGISYNPWRRLVPLQHEDGTVRLVEIFLTRNIYSTLIETLTHKRLAEFQVGHEWFDVPFQIVQKTIREIMRDDLEKWSLVQAKRYVRQTGEPPFRRREFPPP
jgi:hypothetical protein